MFTKNFLWTVVNDLQYEFELGSVGFYKFKKDSKMCVGKTILI